VEFRFAYKYQARIDVITREKSFITLDPSELVTAILSYSSLIPAGKSSSPSLEGLLLEPQISN
jgi:hypothetical protein